MLNIGTVQVILASRVFLEVLGFGEVEMLLHAVPRAHQKPLFLFALLVDAPTSSYHPLCNIVLQLGLILVERVLEILPLSILDKVSSHANRQLSLTSVDQPKWCDAIQQRLIEKGIFPL